MGTMTFGSSVDEALSLRLLDQAYDGGINFYDSAEMYAVPPRAETYGKSEEIANKLSAGTATSEDWKLWVDLATSKKQGGDEDAQD